MLIIGKRKRIQLLKLQVLDQFKIKDNGQVKCFMRPMVDFCRDKSVLRSHQTSLESMLEQFSMESCNRNLLEQNLNICSSIKSEYNPSFRELLRYLMYIMLESRYNIC